MEYICIPSFQARLQSRAPRRLGSVSSTKSRPSSVDDAPETRRGRAERPRSAVNQLKWKCPGEGANPRIPKGFQPGARTETSRVSKSCSTLCSCSFCTCSGCLRWQCSDHQVVATLASPGEGDTWTFFFASGRPALRRGDVRRRRRDDASAALLRACLRLRLQVPVPIQYYTTLQN